MQARRRPKFIHRAHRRARGFNLVEVLLASALLAVVVAGLSQTVVSGQAHTYNALHEERALALAEALMEEALALSYADQGGDTTFGPDTDENTRAVYDGLDDMHGYTEDAGTLADPAGVLYPETYQVFSRAVTVATDTATIAGLGGTIDGMTLTVTVAEAGGREWTITRFVPEPAE